MAEKKTYWLSRADEPVALVEGAAARDEWVRVHGWTETSEPDDLRQVHVVNDNTGGRGALPYGALKGAWVGLGWRAATPPPPLDLTKDPRLVDQPVSEPVTESAKTKNQPAAPAASTQE